MDGSWWRVSWEEKRREGKKKKRAVGESDAKSAQKSSDAVETEGEKVRERVLDHEGSCEMNIIGMRIKRMMREYSYSLSISYHDFVNS